MKGRGTKKKGWNPQSRKGQTFNADGLAKEAQIIMGSILFVVVFMVCSCNHTMIKFQVQGSGYKGVVWKPQSHLCGSCFGPITQVPTLTRAPLAGLHKLSRHWALNPGWTLLLVGAASQCHGRRSATARAAGGVLPPQSLQIFPNALKPHTPSREGGFGVRLSLTI